MNQTRRKFVMVASIAGTGVVLSQNISPSLSHENQGDSKDRGNRCPYFSQPLLCDGSDNDGNYPCDK